MKKIAALLVVFCMLFVSCMGKPTLVGRWQNESGTETVIFKEDGTGEKTVPEFTVPAYFTYTVDGESIRIAFSDGNSMDLRFSLSKDILTMQTDTEKMVYYRTHE